MTFSNVYVHLISVKNKVTTHVLFLTNLLIRALSKNFKQIATQFYFFLLKKSKLLFSCHLLTRLVLENYCKKGL